MNMKHYYGNFVRIIFIVGAVWMLVGLPTMTKVLNIPIGISIVGVVILGIAAGFTNPVKKSSLVINVIISVLYTIIFSYLAWYLYTHPILGGFFFANQIAGIVFLVATYFSVKSLRGSQVPDIQE
jgi:hypothetical protein